MPFAQSKRSIKDSGDRPALARCVDTPPTPGHTTSFASALVAILGELGVKASFGVLGGAIVPICSALADSKIRVIHCRHESGAAFAATEAYFASGDPSLVFTTTGPGLTNALTGSLAAKWEGAKLILVSGATSAAQRGRWAMQEVSPYTFPGSGLHSFFDFAATIEDPVELDEVARRLAMGLAMPSGFVAHLSIPINVQAAPAPAATLPAHAVLVPPMCGTAAVAEYARLLWSEPFVIWAGFGARHAAAPLRALAERTGAPVMCSPRAKGVFPEDHPLYLGVTGFAGDAGVEEHLIRHRPAYILVLGTRLGELTSFWSRDLVPTEAFIQVDTDPASLGTAYPSTPTIGVHAESRSFLSALLDALPAGPPLVRPLIQRAPAPRLTQRSEGAVRPRALMEAVQSIIVEQSDAPVLMDATSGTAWSVQHLRFRTPGRYRASVRFGSMGHASAGVIGAALARAGKVVAIVGDGAMLMLNEISTAVAYGLPAVWIVLNDSQYGMIEHGMRALGVRPVETQLPRTDFVQLARALGADGVYARTEGELEGALYAALAATTPFVVDVSIDPTVPALVMKRVRSLVTQGINE